MPHFSRREFLGLTAATAGAAATAKLPLLVRSAMAMSPTASTASAIRHVVVLMQENRSFDHYFGTLPGVRGLHDRSALRRADGTNVFRQMDRDGKVVTPFLIEKKNAADGLDHSWNGTHAAWNDGRCNRWVPAKGAASMGYLDRAAIPFHFALADAFTVCDHYFCSVMGPTNPNRLYLWSGTCDPRGERGGPVTANDRTDFRWTTYPERLQKAGVDWKIYQNASDNYDDNALAWFRAFKDASPGSPLHARGMASVPEVHGDTCADIVAAIERDVAADKLPFASWIVAPETCSEHPNHSPERGADFIARVLDALMSNPDVWRSTVLLINYDENDGFFDHVPPPVPPRGTPDEFIGASPIGLGPRVPMLVVSPWSRGGHVCSQVFDHTSVIRLMETLTGVRETNISAWRRRVCGDLLTAFDFTAMSLAVAQSADARPSRALPYQPNANARFSDGAMQLTLNNGTLDAFHFAVYVDDHAPRTFDVALSDGDVRTTLDVSDASSTRVTVHGANGFLREFDGVNGEISVACGYDFDAEFGAMLRLTIRNASDRAQRVDFVSHARGDEQEKFVVLDANSESLLTWNVEKYTNGWYDLTVSTTGESDFRWRFAGRIETGRHSFSA